MKFETLGRHILVEYYNCDEEVLKNPKLIEEFMNNSALNAKATIVDSVFHHFNPWGVSGAVIIAESHLTIHMARIWICSSRLFYLWRYRSMEKL